MGGYSMVCCLFFDLNLQMKQFIESKLVHAKTKDDFETAWAEMARQWPAAMEYLNKEWHPHRHRWARPWRMETVTLSYHTTSPAESMNSVADAWMSVNLTLSVSESHVSLFVFQQ
jgi:hypothetical protein